MEFDDLDERIDRALDAARKRDVGEGLLKLAGRGKETLYCWSSGRITAEVHGETLDGMTVHLERQLGNVGFLASNGAALGLDELRALEIGCRAWRRRRTQWAAFYSESAGFGCGGYDLYQPAGSKSEVRQIGYRMMGHRRGKDFVGDDVVVPLDRPRRMKSGIAVVSELWRMGEVVGPKKGALIGVRFDLGGGLTLDAQREEASITNRDDEEVVIEEGETALFGALVRLFETHAKRSATRATSAPGSRASRRARPG